MDPRLAQDGPLNTPNIDAKNDFRMDAEMAEDPTRPTTCSALVRPMGPATFGALVRSNNIGTKLLRYKHMAIMQIKYRPHYKQSNSTNLKMFPQF
jgi:hypothetical protein